MKLGSKLLVAVLVVACSAIALTACGGGGGDGSGGGSAQVKPTIGTQPANQSVVTGSSATFAVIAAGGGTLVYQWKKNGTDISGASSSIYTTPATSSADNDAVFTVLVSNSAGTSTSNAARLAVTNFAVAPAISQQPENQSVVTGTSASFSVSATGTSPLSYQWKKNGADIPGATASTYTTPAASTEDSGAVYSVVVSNSVDKATSNDARLTVAAAAVAPSITSQPADQTVNAGQVASFSVTTSGTSPSYQWKKNGADIPGAISSTYTTPATSIADNAAVFTVVVTNTAGTVTSNHARLTVTAVAVAPTITSQPTAQTVASGVRATFTVAASGTGTLRYQWQKFGADIAGATSPSYTTSATVTDLDNGDLYSVVVTDDVGSVSSSQATLIVRKYSLVVNASGGTYAKTECVRDNSTGLIWEGKNANGSSTRPGDGTYTNYDDPNLLQKPLNFANTAGGSVKPTLEEVNASTNSIGYKNSVNTSGLCGFTDWRLPTVVELTGIKDADQPANPLIDSMWFPNTQSTTYWTSTVNSYVSAAGNTVVTNNAARIVFFHDGYVFGQGADRYNSYPVRLVRGPQ